MGNQIGVSSLTKIYLKLNGCKFELTISEAEQLRDQLIAQLSNVPPAAPDQPSVPHQAPWNWPQQWPWGPGVVPGDSPSGPLFPLSCGALWEVRPQDLPQYVSDSPASS